MDNENFSYITSVRGNEEMPTFNTPKNGVYERNQGVSSPWTEKYRPKKFEDLKGQNEAINKIKNFIENFSSSKKKALILHGPPGTGKTTITHIIAEETNSEIFELNASDLRNKNKLKEILKPAIEQRSLIKQKKIILIDEVDGISTVDRGGLTELVSLIKLSSYPLIMTANDAWNKKLSPLRKTSELIQLKEIDYHTTKEILFSILRKEGLFIDNNIITNLSIKVKGDIRAAINDLQTISHTKDHSSLNLDERNKEIDIFHALRMIFKGKATQEILKVFDSVNMPIDKKLLWIEENIPLEYQGEELANACERLSRADIFKGRIYKQQYWRFLVYENILLSYGVSAAKKSVKTGFTSYKKPTRILKIWMNNQKIAKRKTIAKKYSRYVHIGEKRALQEFFIIKQIIKSNPTISKELKLNEEEVEYLAK
ncbi:replication factor C large subunit [Candidatus Pacearchaeota archaeon]|nr:replication factor C large subunit [Candidatus Pacearchaeota archaeon]